MLPRPPNPSRLHRPVLRRLGLAGLLALALAAPDFASAGEALRVTRAGDTLSVSLHVPVPEGRLALRIHSDRNASIPRFSDVSPLQPEGFRKGTPSGRESWYPVIDLEVDDDMSAVLWMDGVAADTTVSFNGWLRRESRTAAANLRFPSDYLLEWENTLWIDRMEPVLTQFFLKKAVGPPGADGSLATLRPLASDWSGRIELVRLDSADRATVLHAREVAPPPHAPAAARPTGRGFSRERLHAAAAGAIGYTLRSLVRDPRDPLHGGLYVFYDLDARTFRSSHWAWAWGPSAGLLLDARKIPEFAGRFGADRLLEAAADIGRAALRTVPDNPASPVRGIPLSRWDRSPRYDYGHVLAFTPCDAAFLAAWTWVRLDEATGDPVWRRANEALIDAMDGLMTEFPIPPQNYWPDLNGGEWDVKVIDEAGFGVELFAEQYRLTGNPRLRELGRRYMEQHLAALGRDDGLWDRIHFLDGRPNVPSIRMTRGLGWPMEGLLSAHRLLPENDFYLDHATRMAAHLLASQQPGGYWAHRFDESPDFWGIGMKGTALWSWLFYDLHRHSGDPAHLEAARRALGWLLDEQYFGEDENAYGGHVAVSPHSAVGYRPWFRVTSSYGTAYFGLAVLEELKLQEAGR